MSLTKKHLLKILGLGLMYLFAAPALLLKWILQLRKDLRAIERIRTGFIECSYCRFQNPLNRMATCAKCRAPSRVPSCGARSARRRSRRLPAISVRRRCGSCRG